MSLKNRVRTSAVGMGIIEAIITILSRFVISTISAWGYTGILVTMAIESACIPLPSEIIMPFSGYLVTTGQFTMLGARRRRWKCGGVDPRLLCRGAGRAAVCRALRAVCFFRIVIWRRLTAGFKIRRSGRLLQPYAAGGVRSF